jgi:hypothetical protein
MFGWITLEIRTLRDGLARRYAKIAENARKSLQDLLRAGFPTM